MARPAALTSAVLLSVGRRKRSRRGSLPVLAYPHDRENAYFFRAAEMRVGASTRTKFAFDFDLLYPERIRGAVVSLMSILGSRHHNDIIDRMTFQMAPRWNASVILDE